MNLVFDLGALHVPVFVVDVEPGPSFRVVGLNKPAESEIGLPSEHFAGFLFEECLPAAMALMLTERYGACVRSRQPLQFEEPGELSPTGQWYRTTLSPCCDPETGEVTRIMAISQNITQSRRLLAEMEAAAFADPLTGLPNRRGFERAAAQLRADADAQGCGLSLVIVDLDDLKGVNDNHGHRQGDRAIRAAADALSGFLRENEIVARVGGDEFFLALREPTRSDLDYRLSLLRAISANGLTVSGLPVRVGLSAGGAVWEPNETMADVLSWADAEMYATKASRKLDRVQARRGPDRMSRPEPLHGSF